MVEVAWPAILLSQPRFTSIHLAGRAAGALRRVGAVVVGDVVVTDIAEPDKKEVVSKIVIEGARAVKRTNEPWLRPRRDQHQSSVQEHRPISRRRNHQTDPDGRSKQNTARP